MCVPFRLFPVLEFYFCFVGCRVLLLGSERVVGHLSWLYVLSGDFATTYSQCVIRQLGI